MLKLDAIALIAENGHGMPRWFTIMVCAFVALVVMWVCVHPGLDLAPTVFRFTAFAAAVMLVLRYAFRFSIDQLIFVRLASFLIVQHRHSPRYVSDAPLPLRC